MRTLFLCLGISLWGSGCAILVLGTAGVAGGYAISGDGIEGIKDLKYEKVWQAAQEVLTRQGRVEAESPGEGVIVAEVEGSTVRFELKQATPKSILLRVRARRLWRTFPNMNLAKRTYSMILSEAG